VITDGGRRLSGGRAGRARARAAAGRWAWLAAPALYAAASLLLFGLPVIADLGSRIVAADTTDSSAYMWFLAWWPHALLHGLNPFISHAMFAPGGVNLTWATSMPGPSLALAPVTLAFGPALTWNVIALAAPALNAWGAFLLCRRLTARTGASLVAGYVFGFSPYVLLNLSGNPTQALVALVPIVVLLVLGRIEGTLGERGFAIWLALALAGQYLISSEVLATGSVFGALALALGWWLSPGSRAAIAGLLRPVLLAYAGCAILISPFLYYFAFGPHAPPIQTRFSADLASFVVPSPLLALSRHQPALAGSGTASYLGLPLIALLVAYVRERGRERAAWVPALTLLAAAICSLGAYLVVRGQLTSIPGAWNALGRLPVLRYAIPVRLALFTSLAAAVIVALWLARAGAGRRGLWRWALAAAVVVTILPDAGSHTWDTRIADPPFFANGTYRSYLRPSDRVLTVPAIGPNQRWQADTRFAFTLAAGYAGTNFPSAYARYPTWHTLLTGRLTPGYGAQLRRFVAAKGVTAIVVDPTTPGPWKQLFATLGVRPVAVGGVLLYRPPGEQVTRRGGPAT
jgi:hypothetical protein